MKLIRYILLGFLFFYMQTLLAPKCLIFGIAPFFILSYLIFTSINLSTAQAVSISFFLGIAIDLLNPFMLGTHCLIMVILTLIVNSYQGMVKKDTPAPVIMSILLLNTLYLIVVVLVKFTVFGYNSIWLKLFIPELLYNTILTIVLLGILLVTQKLRLVISD